VTEDGEAPEDAPEPANATQHVSLLDARYVGLMSVILGVATVFILPIQSIPETVPVRATEPTPRPLAKPVPTNAAPPVVKPVKPVTFPAVRVRGIIYDPGRPSALIGGKTYYIGDQVQGAKIVAITRDTVLLEIQGQQRLTCWRNNLCEELAAGLRGEVLPPRLLVRNSKPMMIERILLVSDAVRRRARSLVWSIRLLTSAASGRMEYPGGAVCGGVASMIRPTQPG